MKCINIFEVKGRVKGRNLIIHSELKKIVPIKMYSYTDYRVIVHHTIIKRKKVPLTSHFPLPALASQLFATHSGAGGDFVGVTFVGFPMPAVTVQSLNSQWMPV